MENPLTDGSINIDSLFFTRKQNINTAEWRAFRCWTHFFCRCLKWEYKWKSLFLSHRTKNKGIVTKSDIFCENSASFSCLFRARDRTVAIHRKENESMTHAESARQSQKLIEKLCLQSNATFVEIVHTCHCSNVWFVCKSPVGELNSRNQNYIVKVKNDFQIEFLGENGRMYFWISLVATQTVRLKWKARTDDRKNVAQAAREKVNDESFSWMKFRVFVNQLNNWMLKRTPTSVFRVHALLLSIFE